MHKHTPLHTPIVAPFQRFPCLQAFRGLCSLILDHLMVINVLHIVFLHLLMWCVLLQVILRGSYIISSIIMFFWGFFFFFFCIACLIHRDGLLHTGFISCLLIKICGIIVILSFYPPLSKADVMHGGYVLCHTWPVLSPCGKSIGCSTLTDNLESNLLDQNHMDCMKVVSYYPQKCGGLDLNYSIKVQCPLSPKHGVV